MTTVVDAGSYIAAVTDTSTTPAKNRTQTVALVLASMSLVLSLIACVIVGIVAWSTSDDPLPVQSKPQVASASQVEAVAHVTLPPGTVFLAGAYSNGLETRLSAKFRIPRTALDAFIAAGAFTTDLTPGLRAVTNTDDVGGGNLWHPDAAKSVSGLKEQQPTPDGTRRSVLLDLDAPDAITVYLYAGRN